LSSWRSNSSQESIIKGPSTISEIASQFIRRLEKKIREEIRGREAEFVHITIFFTSIIAGILELRRTWTWRSVHGIIEVMNSILTEEVLPLKTIKQLKFKNDMIPNSLLLLVDLGFKLADWKLLKELADENLVEVVKIKSNFEFEIISNISAKEKKLIKYYANCVASDKEYEEYNSWIRWMSPRIFQHKRFVKKFRKDFMKLYKVWPEHIAKAITFFEDWVKNRNIEIEKNHIIKALEHHVGYVIAKRLLDLLEFREGKDVRLSPLIPVKDNKYWIARFVFEPIPLSFDLWIKHSLMHPKVKARGTYDELRGKLFELYVDERVRIEVPEAKNYKKLRGTWIRGEFEIDRVIVKDEYIFLISCKGGTTELPRAFVSKKLWIFPPKEIHKHIELNKEHAYYILAIAEYLTNNPSTLWKRGIRKIRYIVPVIAYAQLQPLCLKELRDYYYKKHVAFVSLRQLMELLKDPKSTIRKEKYLTLNMKAT